MSITIHSHDSGNLPEGQTWDTEALQQEFTVQGHRSSSSPARLTT